MTAGADAARWADAALARLDEAFLPARDPERAAAMARYQRDQFAFLGLASPVRRGLQRAALAALGRPGEAELVALAPRLWDRPEREYQYVGCDLVGPVARLASPALLDHLELLLTTKPWWDTVDALATHGVGPVVAGHPHLVGRMRAWNASDDRWLIRTSILFQLGYGPRTDQDLLFAMCLARADHPDFFVRKAIGWALRQHTRVAPEAVLAFVAEHAGVLSLLSQREAVTWLERRRPAS